MMGVEVRVAQEAGRPAEELRNRETVCKRAVGTR